MKKGDDDIVFDDAGLWRKKSTNAANKNVKALIPKLKTGPG